MDRRPDDPGEGDPEARRLAVGRLQKLERMGLATAAGTPIPGPKKMNALTVITEPTATLPTTILADLDADARQSLSAATRTAYESDWRAFEGWCDARGVDALPSSPASGGVRGGSG